MRPVTVDTGGPDDVFPGASVMWMYQPRGGYGYIIPVKAKIISHGLRPKARVRIEVTDTSGAKFVRVVDAKHLRWPK